MSVSKDHTLDKRNENAVNQAPPKAASPVRVYEYSPDVDIYSDKKAVYIEANVPGVDEKHLDISIEKNVLSIKGEVESISPEGFQLKYAEYYPGNYKRSFHLGEDVDQENIEAVIKNGVLRLKLPVKEAVSKKIPVRSE